MPIDKNTLTIRLMATFVGELEEYLRSFENELDVLRRSGDEEKRNEAIKELLRTAHSLKGASRSVAQDRIESICHDLEEDLLSVVRGARVLDHELIESLSQAAGEIRDAAGTFGAGSSGAGSEIDEPAEQIRTPRSDHVRVTPGKLDALLNRSADLLSVRKRMEASVGTGAAVNEQFGTFLKQVRPLLTELDSEQARTAAARLEQIDRELESLRRELERNSRDLSRVSSRLDEDVRESRMIPFSEAIDSVVRAAEEVARTHDREVRIEIEGGSVELDRGIIDRLRDALGHLASNAVVHGIEPPDERERNGKPRCGNITLKAESRGPNVEIAVDDDGRGIDYDALRRRMEGKEMDTAALHRMLFLPGVTTRATVDQASGRGLGLEVVKNRVEALSGSVDVDADRHSGTSFRLRVPVTLLSLRAAIVLVSDYKLAILSKDIERVVRISEENLTRIEGQPVIHGSEPIPVVSLASLLGITPRPRDRYFALVVAQGSRRLALAVDDIVGEQDIVLKPVGAFRLPLFSGATVLGTGEIALIPNLPEVIASAEGAAMPMAREARARRLLLVEDSITTRAVTKMLLENAGFDVVTASNGEEGWNRLQREGFDLVVTDIEMPQLDGFELTRRIRRSADHRTLPIILVTGRESDEDRQRGMELGADAYITKSTFNQQRLLDAIEQLL